MCAAPAACRNVVPREGALPVCKEAPDEGGRSAVAAAKAAYASCACQNGDQLAPGRAAAATGGPRLLQVSDATRPRAANIPGVCGGARKIRFSKMAA